MSVIEDRPTLVGEAHLPAVLNDLLDHADADRADVLRARLTQELPMLRDRLSRLYSNTSDYARWLNQVLVQTVQTALNRPADLWALDLKREANPNWHLQGMLGYCTYTDKFAGNLAGGTHHASANQGGGFCVFNDIAVTARVLQMEHFRATKQGLQVLVIDLDVHQGNGTADIFATDSSVFTLSLHGEKNFPFRKVSSDLDVGLPDGCSDDAYLVALDDALAQVSQRFQAQFVIYLAGADAHEGDRLGRLKLTEMGMMRRDQRVFDWVREQGLPMLICMGGGYGHDLTQTVQVQMNTWQLAMDHWLHWQNRGL